MRSGSSAAMAGSALVRRNTRMPLSAARAPSPAAAALGAAGACEELGASDPLEPASSAGSVPGLLDAFDISAMNRLRAPSRPGLQKSMMDHRSPRPFSIGVPVSVTRQRASSRRSCWAVSLAGFLMVWASSSTTVDHSTFSSTSRSRMVVP